MPGLGQPDVKLPSFLTELVLPLPLPARAWPLEAQLTTQSRGQAASILEPLRTNVPLPLIPSSSQGQTADLSFPNLDPSPTGSPHGPVQASFQPTGHAPHSSLDPARLPPDPGSLRPQAHSLAVLGLLQSATDTQGKQVRGGQHGWLWGSKPTLFHQTTMSGQGSGLPPPWRHSPRPPCHPGKTRPVADPMWWADLGRDVSQVSTATSPGIGQSRDPQHPQPNSPCPTGGGCPAASWPAPALAPAHQHLPQAAAIPATRLIAWDVEVG